MPRDQQRLITARAKRDFARRLLKQGLGGTKVQKLVKARFGSYIGENLLTELRHELGLGWTHTKTKHKKQPRRVFPEKYQVAVLPRPTKRRDHKLDPDLRECLGQVFGWMLTQGINRIEVDPATLKVDLGYLDDEKDKAI